VVALLGESGKIEARGEGGWVLPAPGTGPPRARREELSARMAEQFALARMVTADYVAVCDRLDVQRVRHEARRSGV
jgi:hypothetical protein